MIEDKELDEIERMRNEKRKLEEEKQAKDEGEAHEGQERVGEPEQKDEEKAVSVTSANEQSLANDFSQRMDVVKTKILQDASTSDEGFVETIKKNVKEAAVTHTEVEKEKAAFAKQSVQYEQEKLSTKQQKNTNEAKEDKWANREKRREFHYNGVKPVMEFVGITKPMNIFLLYFLTFVLIWFFLLSKLWKGTIGALIAGAESDNRSKSVKGFLWTVVGLFAVGILSALVYLFLKWQGIIN